MAEKFTNLARSKLASGMTTGATSLAVLSGDGNLLFPTLSGSDFFRCVLFKLATGEMEAITVGARSGDVFSSITRAAEPIGNGVPSAIAFNAGDLIELRPTSAFFNSLASVTTSAIQSYDFNFAVDTGVNDNYNLTLTPAIAAYSRPQPIMFVAANTNLIGPSVARVNGLAQYSILTPEGNQLINNDIQAGKISYIIWENTHFTLLNPRRTYVTGNARLNEYNQYSEMQAFSYGSNLEVTAANLTIPLTGNTFYVTGATTSEDWARSQSTLQSGTHFIVVFADNRITLRHNFGTTAGWVGFSLPGGQDRLMRTGDIARFYKRGGDYKVSFDLNSGRAPVENEQATIRDIARNMQVRYGAVPATQVTFSCDEIILQNTIGEPVRRANIAQFDVNVTAAAGPLVGGLHTGTVANNTLYYLWIAWDGTRNLVLSATSRDIGVLSTSRFAWTHAALIGAFRTNGSAQIQSLVSSGWPRKYISAPYTTYSAGTTLTPVAHGLSGTIDQFHAEAECITSDIGYSVGDVILLESSHHNASFGSYSYGLQLYRTATTIGGVIGAQSGLRAQNKATGATTALTAGRWRIYIKALKF